MAFGMGLCSSLDMNDFYIDIFDHTWTTKVARFHGYKKLTFSEVLNGVGSGKLELSMSDMTVSRLKIQPYNRVCVMQGSDRIWKGYIANGNIEGQTLSLELRDMFGFLKKRLHTGTYASQSILTTITAVMADINGRYDTQITMGTSTAPTTGKAFELTKQKVDGIISQACKAVGAEFAIDLDLALNLYTQRGVTRSTPILTWRDDRMEVTNLADFGVKLDGDSLVNRLIGTSSIGEEEDTDTASRDQYGLLEDVKSYSADDSGTLSSLVENDLAIMSVLDEIPTVVPVASIDAFAFDVGDTVTVRITRGFYTLDAGYRVIKKEYEVRSSRDQLALKVTLAEKPTFVKTFPTEIATLERRVYNLEQ